MGLPPKLLGNGERELLHLRAHGKTMVWPATSLVLIGALAGVALALMPGSWEPVAGWVVIVIALVVAIPAFVLPLVRWRTTTYTLTNFRLITRTGLLNKSGHDLPLQRISDVANRRSLTDRMFGCGTLVLTTSADDPLVLDDIPDVERVGVQISDLLRGGGPQAMQA